MLARATCARATGDRSSGGAPVGTRWRPPHAMGAVPSRRLASRDASGRVTTASVARDDLVSATDEESSASPDAPVIRTSKDLTSWIAARDGAATVVRCEGALTPDVASSAEALGVELESIVKSLVFAVDGAFVVVVTNGETKVDVKKLASAMGVANRRVRLATREETIRACGFVPGTVPPFGHARRLRTFVDASAPSEIGAGPVFGGGGDADAEVRVETVDELLRLTKGELLDVKKRERAREAPPGVLPAYDERTNTAAARRNENEKNERSDETDERRFPASRRASKNDARSVCEPRIVRAFAEVVRVRRVARFLVFATLRPLAPPTAEAPDAFDEARRAEAREFLASAGEIESESLAAEADDASALAPASVSVGSPVPFPADAEFQLIAGRSLVERIGEDAAERAFRELKAGVVVEVVARTQANPRPRAVDLVARSARVVEGREAISLLAAARAAETREAEKARADAPPPASAYAPREAKEEEWGVGPSSAVADMASFGFGGPRAARDDPEATARKLERLRTGNREGKTEQFPALPRDATHWVASVDAIERMRAAVLSPPRRDESLSSDGPRWTRETEKTGGDAPRFDVVGIDAEWRPQSGSPVALLQIATRREAFLVDTLALCGDENQKAAASLNRFLADLFARRDVVKLGFGLEHDFSRLRRSFPESLACVAEPARVCRSAGFVDVRTLCALAFPEKKKLRKTGLAVTVASVLGAYVDKTEQCSDWARRPLTQSQTAYAAADAHVLTALFDRCAYRAASEVAAALSDPEAPLAQPPDAREGGNERARGGGAKAGRGAPPLVSRAPRPPPGPPMSESDAVRAVGAAFDGRKGVVDALTGFPEVSSDHRGRGGGGLEMLSGAKFALVFVNVHAPEAGRRRRYANEFWFADTGSGSPTTRSVRMSWFGGGGDAGTARGVAKALAETTALREREAFFRAAADADAEAKAKKTLLLFLRKQKGPYVCCGRLRAVAVSGGDDGVKTGARVDFELVDTEALRASGKLEALVGDNLREPRAGDYFPS